MRPITLSGVILALAVAVLASGCAPEAAKATSDQPVTATKEVGEPMSQGITVRYFGHACFTVSDSTGLTVAIDPFGSGIGYPVPELEASICVTTHGHGDHDNVAAVADSPTVVSEPGDTDAEGITFTSIAAPHHAPGENEERGDILMVAWEMDGVKIAHLGDLGTEITPEQVAALGDVDVLLLPVGGHFTIDAAQALAAAEALGPKIIIPMHYKTNLTSDRLPIAGVDEFIALKPDDWVLTQSDSTRVVIAPDEVLQEGAPTTLCVLNHE